MEQIFEAYSAFHPQIYNFVWSINIIKSHSSKQDLSVPSWNAFWPQITKMKDGSSLHYKITAVQLPNIYTPMGIFFFFS